MTAKQNIEPESYDFGKRIDGLLRHINLVQEGGIRIAKAIADEGDSDFARQLVANLMIHDASKFYGIEWDLISHNDEAKDKSVLKIAIDHHTACNPHHPEYWKGIDNMPRIYVAEMVCDWWARSAEFGTNLREWISETACVKYEIKKSGRKWKEMKYFLDLLLEKPF